AEEKEFLGFVRQVTKIWKEHPAFQRRRFFRGRSIRGAGVKDITWLEPSGKEMSDEAWKAGFVKCLGVQLSGVTGEMDEYGKPVIDDTVTVLLNAHHEAIPFTLLTLPGYSEWERLFDTAQANGGAALVPGGKLYSLGGRSIAVFRAHRQGQVAAPDAVVTTAEPTRAQGNGAAKSAVPLIPATPSSA